MKRLSLLWLALALCIGAAYAAPVDVNEARSYGQMFVWNTLGQKTATLSLAYTQVSEAGVDALYIFNYDNGYVVVPADDRAHPILGYCDDQPFHVNDIPEGLKYYLGYYARQIQYAIDNDLPMDAGIAEEWYLVGKEGAVSRTRMEKAVEPLIHTSWDQGWPYNYYAPACNSYWTNNHCYAGCVATAMSQVMKYWEWPETGVGEHSYTTSSYPGNGAALSANFGATTYQWSIMPNQCSNNNANAQAVALLMYHCGIAVDMNYSPNGSGAFTDDVPAAVKDYFRYGSCTNVKSRDNYTKTTWEDMLMAQLDLGIPMVYAGSDSDGGHAFNCDGYNDQRYFHFNYGWSGSYNTYYQIDALNTGNGHFNTNQRAVFDMIPDYIYNSTVPEIETMTVEIEDAITKTAHINWTVPSVSVSGDTLTSIHQIILKRNGVVIRTIDDPQPGEVFEFIDEVPEYGEYKYSIVGENNNFYGEEFSQTVIFGPSCTWKVVCQTTSFQGWNNGILQFVGPNGVVFKELTMTSSSPISQKIVFPEGAYSLQWVEPASVVSSLTITLKNSANQNVFSYSGSSTQLSGSIHSGFNDCPNCTVPTDLEGEFGWNNDGYGVTLSWNCDYSPTKFKIYRSDDGIEYSEIGNVDGSTHEFFNSVEAFETTYYYKVTAYSSACESNPAVTPENTDYLTMMIPSVTMIGENTNDARIYPNPTSGMLSIEAGALSSVAVYNLVGQKVYEETVNGETCSINMKSFGCGMYLVHVTTTNGTITKKISVIE